MVSHWCRDSDSGSGDSDVFGYSAVWCGDSDVLCEDSNVFCGDSVVLFGD